MFLQKADRISDSSGIYFIFSPFGPRRVCVCGIIPKKQNIHPRDFLNFIFLPFARVGADIIRPQKIDDICTSSGMVYIFSSFGPRRICVCGIIPKKHKPCPQRAYGRCLLRPYIKLLQKLYVYILTLGLRITRTSSHNPAESFIKYTHIAFAVD